MLYIICTVILYRLILYLLHISHSYTIPVTIHENDTEYLLNIFMYTRNSGTVSNMYIIGKSDVSFKVVAQITRYYCASHRKWMCNQERTAAVYFHEMFFKADLIWFFSTEVTARGMFVEGEMKLQI